MMDLGIGLALNNPGQIMAGAVLGGPTLAPLELWTPNDDADLLLWYDGSSYETVVGIEEGNETPFDYHEFTNKRTGYTGSTYRQATIGTPTAPANAPILTTVGGIPCIRYRARGTKNTATFSLAGLDAYIVYKPSNIGGAYTRFVDHDYGNGYWMGSLGSPNVGGGIRDGSNPYAVSLAHDTTGWNLLNIMRTTNGAAYRVTIGANNATTGTRNGTAGNTTANPIAIGSELGGNNAVPDLYIAAMMLFNSSDGDYYGSSQSTNAKRQGYIHHNYGVQYGVNLITNTSHAYYTDEPTV